MTLITIKYFNRLTALIFFNHPNIKIAVFLFCVIWSIKSRKKIRKYFHYTLFRLVHFIYFSYWALCDQRLYFLWSSSTNVLILDLMLTDKTHAHTLTHTTHTHSGVVYFIVVGILWWFPPSLVQTCPTSTCTCVALMGCRTTLTNAGVYNPLSITIINNHGKLSRFISFNNSMNNRTQKWQVVLCISIVAIAHAKQGQNLLKIT